MSIDELRGDLIRKALDKGGFNPRSAPMEGDSYRYFIQSLNGVDRESMEIYKKRDSDELVFTGTVFLAPAHLERYRKLDDNTRRKFDEKLEMILGLHDVIWDITEDERGFAVLINSVIDHNLLNTNTLRTCLGSVIDAQVQVYNFFMDFFFDKIKL